MANRKKKSKQRRMAEADAIYYAIVLLFIFYILKRDWINSHKPVLIAGIVLVVCLLIGIPFLRKYLKKKRYLNSPLSSIDMMTGEEFEEYLKYKFESQGYKAKLTPVTNDYGADLVLKKDGEVTVVQAKRWSSPVGNAAIQEIVASKGYYKATKAMVVTNSTFTNNAVNLAKANDVVLWDRNYIMKNFGNKTEGNKGD